MKTNQTRAIYQFFQERALVCYMMMMITATTTTTTTTIIIIIIIIIIIRWELKQQFPGYEIKQHNVIIDILRGWSREMAEDGAVEHAQYCPDI